MREKIGSTILRIKSRWYRRLAVNAMEDRSKTPGAKMGNLGRKYQLVAIEPVEALVAQGGNATRNKGRNAASNHLVGTR